MFKIIIFDDCGYRGPIHFAKLECRPIDYCYLRSTFGIEFRSLTYEENTIIDLVFENVLVEYSPFYLDCLSDTVPDMRSRPK